MKKSIFTFLLGLTIFGTTYGFEYRSFVVNEIHNDYITVSDLDTSIISTKISTSTISGSLPDLEAGIVIGVSCNPDNTFNLKNLDQTSVQDFNKSFERLLNFFVIYDDKFKQKVYESYKNSKGENFIIKGLLAGSLPSSAFSSLKHGSSNPSELKNLSEFCFTDKNQIQELGKDYFYLTTIGKNIVQGTNIISRQERGADETISLPIPVSTGSSQGNYDGTPSHRPTNSSTILENYNKNFLALDNLKVIRDSYDGVSRPLEHFPVNRIIIHHTAGSYRSNLQEGKEYMKSLHSYHGSRLGRGDIGYHFLIDGEGNIYEGRRGGMHTVGAHVLGHNRGSVGISLMTDGKLSRPMLLSLIDLTIYISDQYNLDISTDDIFRNDDLSGLENGPVVVAHKELSSGKPYDPMIPMDLFRKIIKNIKQSGRTLTNSI